MTDTPTVTTGSLDLKQAMLSLFIVFCLLMIAAAKFFPGREAIDTLIITTCGWNAPVVLVGWVFGKAWQARG